MKWGLSDSDQDEGEDLTAAGCPHHCRPCLLQRGFEKCLSGLVITAYGTV
jgi:hypothetical protein